MKRTKSEKSKKRVFAFTLIAALVLSIMPGFGLSAQADEAEPVLKINTVAGSDNIGDGGLAAEARVNYALGVAVDSSGNLYIVDSQNHRIRKVGTDGKISTVAGTGIAGFSGDGGAATSAQLCYPNGVAVDKSGNVFIADTNNSRIRKVDTSGIISTVAGSGDGGYSGDSGKATSALLSNPCGVTVDASGNIFIADNSNSRIRKVDTDGNISTVAGTGAQGYSGDDGAATSAQLYNPTGVAVDSSGNLYIADTNNNRIRKVDTLGIITTVAGTGTGSGNDGGYSGDGGKATEAKISSPFALAVDADGNILFTDSGNNRIRKVGTDGNISTVAGTGVYGYSGDGGKATSAQLGWPSGVAVDSSGNILIADCENCRIRRIGTDGNISTVAGNGYASYSGDGGAAISSQLYNPFGVAVDSSGNLYIADSNNNRIRRVDAKSGVITTVAGTGTGSGDEGGYSGDGGAATSAQLGYPTGVAIDSKNNIYIADTGNNRIRKVDANGIISTVAGTGEGGYFGDGGAATSAQLYYPNGVAVDASGNIFIADSQNHRIRKVDADGNISTLAGTGTNGYSGDSGLATSAQLCNPNGVAVDSSGDIYIADSGNNRIREIGENGKIRTVAGTGTDGYSGNGGAATSAQLYNPSGVAVDARGNIYIADTENRRIRKVDATSGNITTVAGTGESGYSGDGGAAASAMIAYPRGIALDANGNIYIADSQNNRIRKVAIYYDVSFDTGSGSAVSSQSHAKGEYLTKPSDPSCSGYTFGGWYTDDSYGTAFDFAKATITGDTKLFAKWTVVSYSGSTTDTASTATTSTAEGTTTAKTELKSSTGTDKTATASVTEKQIVDAVKAATEAAAKQGTKAAVEISVATGTGSEGITVTIPRNSVQAAANSSIDALKISSSVVSVAFDGTALDAISASASGDLTLKVTQTDSTTLSESDKAIIGTRPVYSLSLSSGGTAIPDFGGGKATISIPYTLASGEDANKIVIYCISGSGELIPVPNCVYDAATGTVTFATTHFSNYAVGYNDVGFTDVSGWYTDYVSYLAARGIIGGTGGGKFSPDANITRAQFVTLIARMSGDELSGYASSEFSDVSTTDWYFAAVQWAYKNGIAAGSDGKFDPNAPITRQDIATILVRYADKVASYILPKTNSAVSFTDSANISSYASAAVTAMQQAGIISGNSDGSFAPTANATRAEAAKMIALLIRMSV